MAFCPKCGKRGITGTFCKECSEKELNLSFKDIIIPKCIECDKFMVQHRWESFQDIDKALIKIAKNKIKNPKNIPLEIIPLYGELAEKPGLSQQIELQIRADIQEFTIPATIEFTYCPICSKKGTQYLEGVLQLRNVTKEVIDFVKQDLKDHSDEVFIVKEAIKGNTADFILSSFKYLRAVGKRLNNRFNGELSENVKLFSKNQQTGKNIYRINVLFKMRDFKVGDVITDKRGRKIKVKTLGKKVAGVDVETGKKVFADL